MGVDEPGGRMFGRVQVPKRRVLGAGAAEPAAEEEEEEEEGEGVVDEEDEGDDKSVWKYRFRAA